ncbi:hypothetical protein [Xenorhabdus sp. TH1]|uniref:hypothetical protein n=1 Tax=Xenorhabdus sp. TH1 TaxID=3130166 RepID=UPI0030CAEFFE
METTHNAELDSYYFSFLTQWDICFDVFKKMEDSIRDSEYQTAFHNYTLEQLKKYYFRKKDDSLDDWENLSILLLKQMTFLALLKKNTVYEEYKKYKIPARVEAFLSKTILEKG